MNANASASARRTGRATTATLGATLALLGLVLLLAGCGADRPAGRWHCPMHPTYVSDREGDCPICGMRLVPVPQTPSDSTAEHAHAMVSVPPDPEKWTCVMCPLVKADGPGRCPTCGMRLQPPDPAAVRREGVPGLAAVAPGAVTLRLAGARAVAAAREPLAREVRAVGRVEVDERRVWRFQARASGWVERLHVGFAGERVRAGQPVLDLYSPELLATQEDFVRARDAAARFAGSDLPEARRGGADLAAAARRRLELLDAPAALIAELEAGGAPRRAVTLTAPASGYALVKDVFAGQRVEPGQELLTIADLDRVWVVASFYESEASLLAAGRAATVSLPYEPGASLPATVAWVAPAVDPATRTLAARLDVANPGLRLRPGMFADVTLRVELGDQLVVPDDAVLDDGRRQYVFVAEGDDGFAPRAVTVGLRDGARAQILSGLAAGERVAVRANFLLDSEARLRAALAGDGAVPHAH